MDFFLNFGIELYNRKIMKSISFVNIYFIWLDKKYLDTSSKGKQWLREEEEAAVLNHYPINLFCQWSQTNKTDIYNDISIK